MVLWSTGKLSKLNREYVTVESVPVRLCAYRCTYAETPTGAHNALTVTKVNSVPRIQQLIEHLCGFYLQLVGSFPNSWSLQHFWRNSLAHLSVQQQTKQRTSLLCRLTFPNQGIAKTVLTQTKYQLANCLSTLVGASYMGQRDLTKSGLWCQLWARRLNIWLPNMAT